MGIEPQGLTVLVVEDEPLVRAVIVAELEDAGFRVIEAGDGEQAMAVVHGGQPVGLLFTDIRLPGRFDGWDIAEAARALNPVVPVIYATGFTGDNIRPVTGARLVHKPYRLSTIIEAARELGVAPVR